jgi:hypothetical protein
MLALLKRHCTHHFIGDPSEEEGIGLRELLSPVAMQLFVRRTCPMLAKLA